jgi:hypothetical protein
MEYKLVGEPSAARLSAEITKLLLDDWQLYGEPFVHLNDGLYCQAVIRKPEKNVGFGRE